MQTWLPGPMLRSVHACTGGRNVEHALKSVGLSHLCVTHQGDIGHQVGMQLAVTSL